MENALEGDRLLVTPEPAGTPRAYGPERQLALLGLTLLALVLAILALALFTASFWILINAGIEYAGRVRRPTGSIALLLGTLGSWCTLYFLHDRIGLIGNARAREILDRRLRPSLEKTPPAARHFVEIRPLRPRQRFAPDVGWLLFYRDYLVFAGDRERVRIPRGALDGSLRRLPTAGGLLPAYVELPLRSGGRLRLLGRQRATRLSETSIDSAALATDLERWLSGDLLDSVRARR